MKSLIALLLLFAVLTATAPAARRVSLRKQCKQQCAAAIDACATTRKKRPRCSQKIQKECRKQGLVVCSTTTTSTTSTTTTTHGPFGHPTTTTTPVATTTSTTTAMPNGCKPGSAENHLEDNPVIVTFANGQFAPSCLSVQDSSQVIIAGDLSSCPLVGGEVANGPDPGSPFSRPGDPVAGTPGEVFWVMPDQATTLPFYCDVPGSSAEGAVFVVNQ
jgi:hypothetical protein